MSTVLLFMGIVVALFGGASLFLIVVKKATNWKTTIDDMPILKSSGILIGLFAIAYVSLMYVSAFFGTLENIPLGAEPLIRMDEYLAYIEMFFYNLQEFNVLVIVFIIFTIGQIYAAANDAHRKFFIGVALYLAGGLYLMVMSEKIISVGAENDILLLISLFVIIPIMLFFFLGVLLQGVINRILVGQLWPDESWIKGAFTGRRFYYMVASLTIPILLITAISLMEVTPPDSYVFPSSFDDFSFTISEDEITTGTYNLTTFYEDKAYLAEPMFAWIEDTYIDEIVPYPEIELSMKKRYNILFDFDVENNIITIKDVLGSDLTIIEEDNDIIIEFEYIGKPANVFYEIFPPIEKGLPIISGFIILGIAASLVIYTTIIILKRPAKELGFGLGSHKRGSTVKLKTRKKRK